MENCYALLGIAPSAATDEIEEAYQRKKREFGADASKQQELDRAYNDARMATFAPIHAFSPSSPLPPLATGKQQSPQPQVQATPAQPEPQAPFPQPQFIQPQQEATVQAAPVQAEPVQYPYAPEAPQPTYQSTYTGSYAGGSVAEEIQGLVEEVPVSFSDAELMNMDVSALRESYMPHIQDDDEETGLLISMGIENKLLRYYVKTYIAAVIFDMAMRLLLGTKWVMLTESVKPEQIPHTPVFLSIMFAFVSIVYCFICVLPTPFAARFFILGQPPDKNSTMWVLFSLGIVFALLLRWLTGRFLPINIVGSAISFTLAAMALNVGTLRYDGG